MSEQLARSYDDTPYVSRAFSYSHPDALATVATLAGLDPAPVERCRVLELGCASGGNLLPMAEALPDSTFLGIDLGARQIEDGRRVVEISGLANLRLQTRSILDVPDERTADFGEFDYIIAHGVYSWVPPNVREKILRICAAHLAPQGVAYISYNTYPGWHTRAMVREMMLYHVEGIESTRERAQQAHALVEFLHHNAPATEDGFKAILRDELKLLDSAGQDYLLHEHLDDFNQPVYFHQFVEAAGKHELRYLGEARQMPLNLTGEARQVLSQLSGDALRTEQYLDFLRNRKFRWSLLVRAGPKLHTLTPVQALRRVRIAGRLRSPETTVAPIESADVVTFVAHDQSKIAVADAPTKRALSALATAWPQTLTFDDLLSAARETGEPYANRLAELLLRSFLNGMIELHVYYAPFVTEASSRPLVSPLQRLLAANGLPMTNRRHDSLSVGEFERLVIAKLDGTRDRAALLDALEQDLRDGRISIESNAAAPESHQLRAFLQGQLDKTLQDLSRSALYLK